MSGAITAIAAVSVAYAAYNGEQQKKAQKAANAQQEAIAQQTLANQKKQTSLQEESINSNNQKKANIRSLLDDNTDIDATNLTGQGVDQDQLKLGKQSLLGS